MASIVTLTANPAVDKSTSVLHILPEQKLRCQKPHYDAGGGGINVSRALKRLGSTSTAVFPAGGRTGALLQELLTKEKIEQEVVETRNETRENFIALDIAGNQQYRFGMPGPEISRPEAGRLLKAIKMLSPRWLILSGSLAPGMETDFYAKVVRSVDKGQTQIVLDTSGEALSEAVDAGIYLVKPNLGELGSLTGVGEMDDKMITSASKQLIDTGKCEVVVVSMGARGAYLVSKSLVDHIPAPSVKKVSTVGAGDSMVAGMVYQLAHGGDLNQMARMGVACGTAATMHAGTELFQKKDAQKLYSWLMKK